MQYFMYGSGNLTSKCVWHPYQKLGGGGRYVRSGFHKHQIMISVLCMCCLSPKIGKGTHVYPDQILMDKSRIHSFDSEMKWQYPNHHLNMEEDCVTQSQYSKSEACHIFHPAGTSLLDYPVTHVYSACNRHCYLIICDMSSVRMRTADT